MKFKVCAVLRNVSPIKRSYVKQIIGTVLRLAKNFDAAIYLYTSFLILNKTRSFNDAFQSKSTKKVENY